MGFSQFYYDYDFRGDASWFAKMLSFTLVYSGILMFVFGAAWFAVRAIAYLKGIDTSSW